MEAFEAERIRLVAASVDPMDKSQELVDELGVAFPVAYGLDAGGISEKTGGFYNERENYLQPTGILVRPDHTVEIAVYSTGPIGRFVAEDVLKIVRYYQNQQ